MPAKYINVEACIWGCHQGLYGLKTGTIHKQIIEKSVNKLYCFISSPHFVTFLLRWVHCGGGPACSLILRAAVTRLRLSNRSALGARERPQTGNGAGSLSLCQTTRWITSICLHIMQIAQSYLSVKRSKCVFRLRARELVFPNQLTIDRDTLTSAESDVPPIGLHVHVSGFHRIKPDFLLF